MITSKHPKNGLFSNIIIMTFLHKYLNDILWYNDAKVAPDFLIVVNLDRKLVQK